MREILSQLLLSDNACSEFLGAYKNEFKHDLDELIPEVETCLKQDQRSDWHIYNVLEHILHSVEEMNRMSVSFPEEDREFLAYVMFFHDLGKPECHALKEVDGKVVESFKGHDIASEKIAKRVLPLLGFDDKIVLTMAKLVRDHDIFLKLSESPKKEWQIRLSPKFVADYIDELDHYGEGKRLFEYLLMVGIADNNAQNPLKTKEPISLINKIRKMLDNRI